jgi:hypothetical protein
MLYWNWNRIYEDDDVYAAIDARTESLQHLRELGPPDLVYLVKQPKTNPNRQVRSLKYPPSICFHLHNQQKEITTA